LDWGMIKVASIDKAPSFSSADESSPVGVERPIVNAEVATVPGSIQASCDPV